MSHDRSTVESVVQLRANHGGKRSAVDATGAAAAVLVLAEWTANFVLLHLLLWAFSEMAIQAGGGCENQTVLRA